MSGNVINFTQQYGQQAFNAAKNLGLTQQEVLSQWGLETGWGSHFAGKNNPGNISSGGKVNDYPTFRAGVSAYESAMRHLGVSGITDPGTFASTLGASGYATDPNYGSKLLASENTLAANSVHVPGTGQITNKSIISRIKKSFLFSHSIGDYSIIAVGVVLIIGAALISQRKTIVKVVETAAKVGAVAG